MKKLALFFFLFFYVVDLSAKETVFNNDYTIWKDADILIWTKDSNLVISAKELCFSLKRINPTIGEPKCRIFGEWERDSVASLYGHWLKSNLSPDMTAEHLRARSPEMVQKINDLEDKTVIFLTQKENQLYVALFEELSASPKTVQILPYSNNQIEQGEIIANALFKKKADRRLTKDERKKKAEEPDSYYLETAKHHSWIGVAYGKTQAPLPLTPKSWYKNKLNSRIKSYRNTKDSLSLWNFIEDEAPLTSIYFGRTWYGFIGAEFFYRYSSHKAKIDNTDPIYQELDYWKFSRHEIGLSLVFSKNYQSFSFLQTVPYAFIGFQYSFFNEDISLKEGIETPSRQYETRIKFENAYKGALIGAGTHLIFFKHYGINLKAGIGSRGRMLDSDPSSEAASEPTIIGGSTVDCFASIGIEYYWSIK
ncbi:MAG: hypothetical protein GX545_05860 [Fibrobacter sp.]|nr:hypothetical protein [Fibrobacter sp.]